MKKNLIKVLCTMFIGMSIFGIAAHADDYKWEVNDDFNKQELQDRNSSNQSGSYITYIFKPFIVNADISQWDYRYPNWIVATPDFEQAYCNAWVNTNGNWYYINHTGYMVENQMLEDQKGNKYYITKDGTLLTNANYIDYYDDQTKYHANSDGILTEIIK